MLDLSAAFDTIDHNILLSRLCNVQGITDNALDWFRSYLISRIQHVVIEDSALGAWLWGFSGFCFGYEDLLHVHQTCLWYHSAVWIVSPFLCTQLYMTIDHSNNYWWAHLAHIELNDDKTELIVLHQDLYNDLSITFGVCTFSASRDHSRRLWFVVLPMF